MLKKTYSKTGNSCRVTFKFDPESLSTESETSEVAVLGEWNSWDLDNGRMTRRKDGSFSKTVSLDAKQEYRFRYLVDGETWLNDEEADSLVPNRFGSQDGVLAL
ncbi:MAG: isoamylase early set domain-containing protein [Acidobacteriota bacterium]